MAIWSLPQVIGIRALQGGTPPQYPGDIPRAARISGISQRTTWHRRWDVSKFLF